MNKHVCWNWGKNVHGHELIQVLRAIMCMIRKTNDFSYWIFQDEMFVGVEKWNLNSFTTIYKYTLCCCDS